MKPKALTLILLVTGAVSYSQQAGRKFLDRVEGLEEIGRIAQEGVEFRRPKFSADGRWIAFTSLSPNSPTKALWIAGLNDLKPRLLVEKETISKLKRYSWSPDGERIAYVDGRMMKVVDVRTGEVTSYNTVSPFMSSPVFDARGNLAFVGNTDLGGNRAAAGGDVEKVKQLTPRGRPYLVAARPPGKKRFIDEQAQLVGDGIIVPYILSPRREVYLKIGGVDSKITPPTIAGANPNCLDAILSPDRKKVLIHCMGTRSHLSVYRIGTKRSYDLGAVAEPGSWSPNSDHVLYLVEISDGHVVFSDDLYITHYTGGKKVKIARAKGIAHGASWGEAGLIAYDEEGKIVVGRLRLR